MRGTAERQALPPAFMRGEGHAVAGGVLRRSGGDCLLSHGFAVPAPPEGKPRVLRTVPAPRIYEGGGPRSGRGSSPRRSGGNPLSHGFAVPAPPEGKPRALRTVPAPRIYEGGGPRSGRGSLSAAAAGKASSVTASPCQLPQRGSRGCFAPPRNDRFPADCFRTARPPTSRSPVLHFPGDYGTMQNVSF